MGQEKFQLPFKCLKTQNHTESVPFNLNILKVRADFVNKDLKGFRGQNLSCKAQVVKKQQQPDI